MEDETEEILRKKRRERARRNFTIAIIILLVLSILTPFILLILGIILMLAGVSAMYDLGGFLNAFLKDLPREKKTWMEKAYFDRAFYEGIVLSLSGFGMFLLALYLMGSGWRGVLGI